jgi:hypothetical protein
MNEQHAQTPTTSAPRIALAAALSVLPFVGALIGGLYLALLGPPIAAVAIRLVASWRAWIVVAVAVTAAATLWGGYAWLQMNAHCTVYGPLVPALMVGLSALGGAAAGAWLTKPAGSLVRAIGGLAVGLVVFAALAVLTTFIAVQLGLPALLVGVSHC